MFKRNQDISILLAVAAGLIIVSLLAVQWPQRKLCRAVRMQVADQIARLQAETRDVHNVPAMVRQVQAMREQYKDFNSRLPKSRELFGFLEEISQTVREAKLDSEGIQPGTPIRQDLYNTLPIVLRFRGTYPELTQFLGAIDRIQRLTRVQKLEIHADPRQKDLGVTLCMNIYFTEK